MNATREVEIKLPGCHTRSLALYSYPCPMLAEKLEETIERGEAGRDGKYDTPSLRVKATNRSDFPGYAYKSLLTTPEKGPIGTP